MRKPALLLAVVTWACASGGGRTTSDVQMPVYSADSPPSCPYEEVGRIALDKAAWATTAERQEASQNYREQIKRMGGDAVVYSDPPREYLVIRFTDPECTE